MATTVEIKNIGPIETLSIPVPEKGGVVVLRGRQGDGKSTAIRAVAAIGGRADKTLSVRDSQKNGSVEFGGVKLSVSRARQTKSGELEVDSIEGRFDIGRLVDPQIADDERADAARIKQLLALTGAKADSTPYRDMVAKAGLEIEIDDDTDDPIELYRRVKKACDQAGLRAEKEGATLPEFAGDAPTGESISVADAQKSQEAAAIAFAKLEARRSEADKSQKAHAAALQRMAELEAVCTSDTPAAISERVEASEQRLIELTKELDSLQTRIAAERSTLREAKAALSDAERHESKLAEARKALESLAGVAIGPSVEEIDAARKVAVEAREATQAAVIAQQQRQEFAAIKAKVDRRRKIEREAETWRELAKRCETVLAQSLPESVLRVDGARLVTATDRSPCEPYGDLSHGERSIIAIGIVSQYLPPGGLATISQEIWSGISPANQERINAEAKKRGIVIVTADVLDAPLTAEVM